MLKIDVILQCIFFLAIISPNFNIFYNKFLDTLGSKTKYKLNINCNSKPCYCHGGASYAQ